jgi:hypothetical protein
MACRRRVWGGLAAWAALLAVTAPAFGQPGAPAPPALPVRAEEAGRATFALPHVPLEALSPAVRENARRVLERPTLSAHGPLETFNCQPAAYHWLLDHPDQAVRLWRLVGARVMDLEDRGAGRFGWRDGQGNEAQWETVLRAPGLRVWYCEGKAKPGALLPAAHGRALVLLQYQEGRDAKGRPAVRHQVHLLLRADSRALAAVARMLGGPAPRLAEQYLGQLEMFFGALAWHLDQNAERAARLFRQIGQPVPGASPG